jgi:molecular chaperone DnaK
MGNLLGIDLGTTFSAMATINETGRAEIICNDEGDRLTPSCVEINKNEVIVGEEPRKYYGIKKEVFSRFKSDMGNPNKTYKVHGKLFTPTELSAFVLKKLYQEAKKRLGEISETIVTIPANWDNEARDATLTAAKSAGLDVRYIINEPTAAALCYAADGKLEKGTYAVFDLGGGTFDISIIKVDNFKVDVITSNGVKRLGGDNFDKAIIKYVAKKYKKTANEDLKEGDFTPHNAESIKRALTVRKKTLIQEKNMTSDIPITREDFEELISTYVAQIKMSCEATIKEAKLKKSEIIGVLLAGGSTRVPIIKSTVEKIFGSNKLIETENVDEVVAKGAAVYAMYKTDEKALTEAQKQRKANISVTESAGKCFGTAIFDGFEIVNIILIPKNTKIPYSITETYYTIYNDQRAVECKVTECTQPDTSMEFVNIVAKKELPLPSHRPKGQPVDVTFSYNENQTMECSFKDVETGEHREIELKFSENKADNVENIEDFFVE